MLHHTPLLDQDKVAGWFRRHNTFLVNLARESTGGTTTATKIKTVQGSKKPSKPLKPLRERVGFKVPYIRVVRIIRALVHLLTSVRT